MPSWIDFKELRSKLKFEDVLQHYGVELTLKGEQHTGNCPLPSHNGKRNGPVFSANLERGIFQCFGCRAKGNVLDFAALMERADPKDGRELKKVALTLRERFCPGLGSGKTPSESKSSAGEVAETAELPLTVNAPLDFELKDLDVKHPLFAPWGLTRETVESFGLGYCARGSVAGRIAIPLHDADGQLVGYAGRVVDEKPITAENPEYQFPSRRVRDGRTLEFRKADLLYNVNRISPGSETLIVVQDFTSVWWLTQNGFPRVVATMGDECSREQIGLIVRQTSLDARVWVLPAGDDVGEEFADSVVGPLSRERFVRCATIEDGKVPTDLSTEELKLCMLL